MSLPSLACQCPRFSKSAWDQLRAKTRKEFLWMVEKDGSWERLWGKSGHPRFINRRRRWPHNIVVIHVSSIKKMPPSLLKHILAVLGWTEPWLRRKGFVK